MDRIVYDGLHAPYQTWFETRREGKRHQINKGAVSQHLVETLNLHRYPQIKRDQAGNLVASEDFTINEEIGGDVVQVQPGDSFAVSDVDPRFVEDHVRRGLAHIQKAEAPAAHTKPFSPPTVPKPGE